MTKKEYFDHFFFLRNIFPYETNFLPDHHLLLSITGFSEFSFAKLEINYFWEFFFLEMIYMLRFKFTKINYLKKETM